MSADKPTVYLDSNILSMLFYRGSDVRAVGWQVATWDWWETEGSHFRVFTSRYILTELATGEYPGQAQALALVRRQTFLLRTREAKALAARYLGERLIPESKLGDAVQLALATAHGMDYLLTWNCAHLANVETQRRLREVNRRLGLRSPLLVSPDMMPKAALGQEVRRHVDD